MPRRITAGMRLCPAMVAFALAVLLAGTAGAEGASRFTGTYTTQRPSADGMQLLTLVLQPGGRASLTTRYPDIERRIGPSVLPIAEAGTWRDRGTTAEVRLTSFGLVRDNTIIQPRRDDNVMTFVLVKRCLLRAVRYSKISYGEVGLTLEKSNCR